MVLTKDEICKRLEDIMIMLNKPVFSIPEVDRAVKELHDEIKNNGVEMDIIIRQDKSLQILAKKLKERDMKIMAEKQFIKYLADRLVRAEQKKGQTIR